MKPNNKRKETAWKSSHTWLWQGSYCGSHGGYLR